MRNSSVVGQRRRVERERRRRERQRCRQQRVGQRRMFAMWSRSQGLRGTVIEDVADADGAVVISVRPRAGERERCGKCHRRCRYRDEGDGRRRWRGLDNGVVSVYVEADAPRVCCPEHGVVVAAVPWARHDAGFTRMFDDLVAWKVVEQSAKAVCEELGSRGARSGGSASGCAPSGARCWTRCLTCARSALMRFRCAAASVT